MKTIADVAQYLTDAGVFFMATEDGDQPKCRPLGFKVLIGETLYFGIGDFKDVYKQMLKNPKVEINACKGGEWLRVYGTAVFEKDFAIADKVLENSPLKAIYNEETGNKMMIFHLENATAEFRGMMDVQDTLKF